MGKDKKVLYIGNLRNDLPLRDLKNNLLDLFLNYMDIPITWNDIDVKKGKRSWFAFIGLHGVREASETLEELETWENRRNLGYNFIHIAQPFESIVVDYKKTKKPKKVKKEEEYTSSTHMNGSVDSETMITDNCSDSLNNNKNNNADTSPEGKSKHKKKHPKKSRSVDHITDKVKTVSISDEKGTDQSVNPVNLSPQGTQSTSIGTSVTGLPLAQSSGIGTSTTGLPSVLAEQASRLYVPGQIIGMTESRNTEFKLGGGENSKRNLRENVCKYMCGSLNSKEGGTLYVGVEDSGKVVGIDCSRKTEDEYRLVIDEAMKTIRPSIFPKDYDILFVPVAGQANKKVLEITVKPPEHMTELYSSGGHIYVRRDGSLQTLKGQDVQEWSKKNYEQQIERMRAEHQRERQELMLVRDRSSNKSKACAVL